VRVGRTGLCAKPPDQASCLAGHATSFREQAPGRALWAGVIFQGRRSCQGPRGVGGGDLPGPKVLVISQDFRERVGAWQRTPRKSVEPKVRFSPKERLVLEHVVGGLALDHKDEVARLRSSAKELTPLELPGDSGNQQAGVMCDA